jgi:hypothetical protein
MRHQNKTKPKKKKKKNHGKQIPGTERHIDVQNRQTDKGREQQPESSNRRGKVGTLLLKETICHGS